jgi:four helix bundle protein
MAVRHYQELIVWQKAMDLVMEVYGLTEGFPEKERYGLTNQIRRAAVSIPSNIAEGQGRNTTREFLRYLSVARGSLQELETQVMIAHRLHYLPECEMADILKQTSQVSRLLRGLSRSLTIPERPTEA